VATIAIPSGKPPAAADGIQIVGTVRAVSNVNTATHVARVGGAVLEGDLILLHYSGFGDPHASRTGPSGFTEVHMSKHRALFAKVADGSEAYQEFTFTNGSTATRAVYVSQIVRGVGGVAAIQVQATSDILGPTWDPPAFTPSGGSVERLWLIHYTRDYGAAFSTAPSGYSTRQINSTGKIMLLSDKVAVSSSDNPSPEYGSWDFNWADGVQYAIPAA
jgi:hypothetical protein